MGAGWFGGLDFGEYAPWHSPLAPLVPVRIHYPADARLAAPLARAAVADPRDARTADPSR